MLDFSFELLEEGKKDAYFYSVHSNWCWHSCLDAAFIKMGIVCLMQFQWKDPDIDRILWYQWPSDDQAQVRILLNISINIINGQDRDKKSWRVCIISQIRTFEFAVKNAFFHFQRYCRELSAFIILGIR